MSKYEDRLPANADAIMRRIQSLEAEVRELRAARRLEASTIGRGGITVQGGAIVLRDASGNEIARMGSREDLPPEPDGDTQPGFILRRNDGSIAFTLDDPNPAESGYRQLLKMQDAQGNIIFSEDANSGWGIATPTFAIPLYNAFDNSMWPGTTDTTFGGVWLSYAPAWNPILDVGVTGTCTGAAGATSGQIRLLINGIVVGSTLNVTAGDFPQINWSVDIPDLGPGFYPGAPIQIAVEARRTAGTGKVQVQPLWVYGRGSEAVV